MQKQKDFFFNLQLLFQYILGGKKKSSVILTILKSACPISSLHLTNEELCLFPIDVSYNHTSLEAQSL